jgi:hypothetical protein
VRGPHARKIQYWPVSGRAAQLELARGEERVFARELSAKAGQWTTATWSLSDGDVGALTELNRQLHGCAASVESLETLILELIGRAGRQRRLERDRTRPGGRRLAQQLRRLAGVAEDLPRARPGRNRCRRPWPPSARRVSPSAVAGEMDLF